MLARLVAQVKVRIPENEFFYKPHIIKNIRVFSLEEEIGLIHYFKMSSKMAHALTYSQT